MTASTFFATGFGIGRLTPAPGTAATLAAWLIGLWMARFDGAVWLAIVFVLFLAGIRACGVAGRELGAADHPALVIDEIVAFLLVLAILPGELAWQIAGFVLFRFFDIFKPAPIDAFEHRFQGGFGVMFDDLIAAGYTLFILALAKRIFL